MTKNICIDCGREFNPNTVGASSIRGSFCNKKFISTISIPQYVKAISNVISNKYEVYLVGGCVRDSLLGGKIKDFDLATNATPDQLMELFPESDTVGKHFGVLKIPVKEDNFKDVVEVATFRKDGTFIEGKPVDVEFTSAKEDASRRDFTINALLMNPNNNEIIDHVNGLEDLNKKIIRAVGNPEERFQEDSLRILRAIRFSSSLDFNIEEKTYEAIIQNKKLLANLPGERIREELYKIFKSNPKKGMDLINKTNLLSDIFPMKNKINEVEVNHTNTSYLMALQEASGVDSKTFSNKLKLDNAEIKNLAYLEKNKDTFLNSSDKTKYFVENEIALLLDYCETINHPKIKEINLEFAKYNKNPIDLSLIPSGELLMSLGFKPGPIFNKIRQESKDKLILRELSSKADILNFISKYK